MRVRYLPVAEGRRLHIDLFPNFSASGSVKGMKEKYYGKDALLVRCGSYIYCVWQRRSRHSMEWKSTTTERTKGETNMSGYQKRKNAARKKAIAWQHDFENHNYSYGELAAWGEYFAKLGKRYGLTEEFRENGII